MPANTHRRAEGTSWAGSVGMEGVLRFVTYNGIYGHPTLSFVPDLLMASAGRKFGSAIRKIEVYAHIRPSRTPLKGLEFMRKRFVKEHLPTLPQAWFHRKQKRIEISYVTMLGTANQFAKELSANRGPPDFDLLRRACAEVAPLFDLIQDKLKPTDNFAAAPFLKHIQTRATKLATLTDKPLARLLQEAKAAEQARLLP